MGARTSCRQRCPCPGSTRGGHRLSRQATRTVRCARHRNPYPEHAGLNEGVVNLPVEGAVREMRGFCGSRRHEHCQDGQCEHEECVREASPPAWCCAIRHRSSFPRRRGRGLRFGGPGERTGRRIGVGAGDSHSGNRTIWPVWKRTTRWCAGRSYGRLFARRHERTSRTKEKARCCSHRASRNTPGSDLLSHALAHAVPSAVEGLTSVFGMGTGVTPLL